MSAASFWQPKVKSTTIRYNSFGSSVQIGTMGARVGSWGVGPWWEGGRTASVRSAASLLFLLWVLEMKPTSPHTVGSLFFYLHINSHLTCCFVLFSVQIPSGRETLTDQHGSVLTLRVCVNNLPGFKKRQVRFLHHRWFGCGSQQRFGMGQGMRGCGHS